MGCCGRRAALLPAALAHAALAFAALTLDALASAALALVVPASAARAFDALASAAFALDRLLHSKFRREDKYVRTVSARQMDLIGKSQASHVALKLSDAECFVTGCATQ